MANTQCKECGCVCIRCSMDQDVHLHGEIENLKQQLVEKHNHIVSMETNFLNEANKYPNGELLALHDELLTWQDKYKRLYDAHRRVQRVNQGLEDKLLRLVDMSETDKNTLTKDIATLSYKLAEANYSIKKLTEDNERYKNDVSLAIQFLQCKPGNFVAQKYDTLPNEVQAKVSNYMVTKRKTEEKKSPPEIKSIKVPIPTFPPTAMVYSVPKAQTAQTRIEREPESPVDIVSAAIMAKVLEERERERSCVKHCDTCTCSNQLKIIHNNAHHSIATQTTNTHDHSNSQIDSLCLQCNHKLDRDRSSMTIIKGVSSNDQSKNKSIPVYIHDYNESNAIVANIAKVQPNNFLNGTNDCSKLRKETTDSTNKLGSVRIKPLTTLATDKLPVVSSYQQQESDNLIDIGSTSSTPSNKANEVLYFANEMLHKRTHKVQIHENGSNVSTVNVITPEPLQLHKTCLQYQSLALPDHHKSTHDKSFINQVKYQPIRSVLLDNSTVELPQSLLPISRVPDLCKASSLSSGEQSEMTYSEPTNSASNYQRVEEWMESINLTETAVVGSNCETECSESLVSSHNERKDVITSQNLGGFDIFKAEDKILLHLKQSGDDCGNMNTNKIIEADIDTNKYREMEDHVKKFLFGEYTILSDVKNNDYD